MRQLTAREAALLRSETATNLGHASIYTVVDPTDAPFFNFETLAETVEARLDHFPELRWRLREVPLHLDRPWWEDDVQFDVNYHLRHIGVPSSGIGTHGSKEAALLARLHERPLTRTRPLWELYLIDRPDGTAGIFVKIHHTIVDGVTGLDLVAPLTGEEVGHDNAAGEDDDNDATTDSSAPPVRWRAARPASDHQLLTKAAWSQLRSPLRWARLGVSLARNVPVIGPQILPSLAAQWAAPTGDLELDPGELSAPRLSFNRALGPSRKVAISTLPVSDIHKARQQNDVRFNDVVLAVVGGGLRKWLERRGELPDQEVVALAPILVNSVDQPLGTALVGLATHRISPIDRLMEVHQSMDDILKTVEAHPVDTVRYLYRASPAAAAMASRLLARTSSSSRFNPPFNLVVVSVPGSDSHVEILGAPVVHRFSLPSLIDGSGLSVCVTSRADTIDVCAIGDRSLVPDLQSLVDGFALELDALITG